MIDPPTLHTGDLSDEALGSYLVDVEALGQILAVIPKRAARDYVANAQLGLAEGIGALRGGALRGLQVRYLYQGHEWWDTVMPAGGGTYRLVRVDQGLPEPETGSASEPRKEPADADSIS